MKILAIDLGTNMGWCLGEPGKTPTYGTVTLAKPKEIAESRAFRDNRREDLRIRRLWKWVRELVLREQPNIVVWEDVEFSTYTYQVQLWSSLRTVLQLGARSVHDSKQPMIFECVPVATLKVFAAHHGATKESMKKALKKKHSEIDISTSDDNAIDAIWLYKWAEFHMARIFKPYERTAETSKATNVPTDLPQCRGNDDEPTE